MTRLLEKIIAGFQTLKLDPWPTFDSIHWCCISFYWFGYERIVGFQRKWRRGWVPNSTGSGKTLHIGPLFAYQWR